VAARGKFMQEACSEKPSTMRVVLGLEPEKVQSALPENVWIANLNCPGQVVIAGLTSRMQEAEEAIKAQGAKRVLPLEVSGAFHTPLMRSAQMKLEPMLRSAKLLDSKTELVMNVPGDFVRSTEEIRTHLIDQVASPTRWEAGVRKMDEAGALLFIEMGPGKTLAGMNRKIGVKAPTMSIENVKDLESIHATT
jgi:[acyl-carrier-protein] S-malonyltransferase